MGFIARLRTGWALAVDSLGVLRRDPELMAFPLVAGVAGTAYLAVLLGVQFFLLPRGDTLVFYAWLFVLYAGSTFIASFVTAGLIHQTRAALEGVDPSFVAGLRAAWRNVGTIAAWAVVAATVGVVLRVLQSRTRDDAAGQLLTGLFSVAWAVLTYFVVPVIVFEDVSIKQAIERSGKTFTDTWGETTGAGFGVGLVTGAFLLVAFVVAVALFFLAASTGSVLGTWTALAAGALLVLLAYLAGVTLSGIARTALYLFATGDVKPGQFDDVDFTTLR